MGNNLSRNNHYLSQMYLEAWKNKNNKVEVYELLVPNDNVPKWQPKSTKSIGSLDSIFVRLNNGFETDDIENWFNKKYETPVKEALKKAINDERITIDEWHKLIDFVACHAVRTPAFLIKTLEIGKNSQKIFDDVMKQTALLKKEDIINFNNNLHEDKNNSLFPFKMTNLGENENKQIVYKGETIIGKQFYLWGLKNTLEKTAIILHKHKWGIITIDKRVSLPTSDDPVICLNYNDENNYDFNGGWGKANCNILFPISPNKILYTQVGRRVEPRWNVDYKMSLILKKIIIEHSYRIVISNFKDDYVETIRTRFVNKDEYLREKKMWEDFQKDYLEKEAEYIK